MDLGDFRGEFGGIVASAFISGVVTGWGFCWRTMAVAANRRIEQLEVRASEAEDRFEKRYSDLENKYDGLGKEFREYLKSVGKDKLDG